MRYTNTTLLAYFASTLFITTTYAEHSCASGVPVVNTAQGKVCGIKQTAEKSEAFAYLGIPYAEPPVGKLRWKNPVPAKTWGDDVYQATSIKPECVQPAGKSYAGSENCLYLNVWRPQTTSKKPRAVMVFIPGGGFLLGQGGLPAYNGTHMADTGDVVVVTMNYRLGSLGFLRYTNNGAAIEGNFGILDQLTAMRWVKNNIRQFGGDPDKITLFGESAGAVSVGLHLFAVPDSQSLFRAAIMESNTMSVPYLSANTASKEGQSFVNNLCKMSGNTSNCPKDGDWLRKASVKDIMNTEFKMMPPGGMAGLLLQGMTKGALWAPTAGVAPVIGQAFNGYNKGMKAKPYVFGFNHNEGVFFTPFANKFTDKNYLSILKSDFGKKDMRKILNYKVNGRYPYRPENYKFNKAADMTPAAQAMAAVLTHYCFAAGNLYAAEHAWPTMQAAKLPMHGYFFTHISSFNYSGLRRCDPKGKNVCHTDELPYVFHNFVTKIDGSQLQVPKTGITKAEIKLTDSMQTSWTGFAKHPLDSKKGWGHKPITKVTDGPYIDWRDPPAMINDLGKVIHYDFWRGIANHQIQQLSANKAKKGN